MIVKAHIETNQIENDEGIGVMGTIATCSVCKHETKSFGDSNASMKRCLVLLRDQCPRRQRNFYKASS